MLLSWSGIHGQPVVSRPSRGNARFWMTEIHWHPICEKIPWDSRFMFARTWKGIIFNRILAFDVNSGKIFPKTEWSLGVGGFRGKFCQAFCNFFDLGSWGVLKIWNMYDGIYIPIVIIPIYQISMPSLAPSLHWEFSMSIQYTQTEYSNLSKLEMASIFGWDFY